MVAIDVESTPYVEPKPEVWSTWVAEAARRHVAEDDELLEGERPQTRLVSEAALIEVGRMAEEIVGHQLPGELIHAGSLVAQSRVTYEVAAPSTAPLTRREVML